MATVLGRTILQFYNQYRTVSRPMKKLCYQEPKNKVNHQSFEKVPATSNTDQILGGTKWSTPWSTHSHKFWRSPSCPLPTITLQTTRVPHLTETGRRELNGNNEQQLCVRSGADRIEGRRWKMTFEALKRRKAVVRVIYDYSAKLVHVLRSRWRQPIWSVVPGPYAANIGLA